MDIATHPRADELFAHIMFQFRQALAFMLRRGLADALYLLADRRVLRLVTRFKWLAARYRAGTLLPPRPRAAPVRHPRTPRPPDGLPRQAGWLCALAPPNGNGQLNASACGLQLAYMIRHNADMRAMIAADPRFGRVLRPLLHMLGVPLGPDLPLPPPPRARTPEPAADAAAPPPASVPMPDRPKRRVNPRGLNPGGLNPVTGLPHPDPFFRG